MNKEKSQHGFTLVELALVLIIFGTVTSVVMGAFTLFNKQKTAEKTNDSISNSNSAIVEYVANFGVYPCPADPTLGPGDANYGRELRGGGLPITDPNYDRQACITPAPVVSVLGEDSMDPGNAPDPVIIGSVPFRTIADRLLASGVMYAKFNESETVDGFGRKLTYAVSQNLTNRDTYNSFFGAIDVVDENDLSLVDENEDTNGDGVLNPGEDTNGNGILDFGQYAHFVLVSHGENGRGAYLRNGTQVAPCVLGVVLPMPLPVGTSAVNETENCDNLDAEFLSGLKNDREDSYNDDQTKFSFFVSSALWRSVGNNGVENTNPGNVGIGTATPQEMFHVTSEIIANVARARAYTDRTGLNAMPPDALAGNATTAASTAMQCPAGQVATRVEGGAVTCGSPFGATPPANMLCPVVGGVQFVMYGIQNTGGGGTSLLCCDPTAPNGAPNDCP